MKKTLLLSLLCLKSLSCIATDTDHSTFYLKISGGPSLPSKVGGDFPGASITSSAVYGAALGYNFNKNFSADLSFDYRPSYKNNFTDTEDNFSYNYLTKIKSLSLMANIYYNFNSFYNFIPYVTVGGGIAKNKTEDSIMKISDKTHSFNTTLSGSTKNNFIYKAGLGVKYNVRNNLDIGIQYQFINLGKFETGKTFLDGSEVKEKHTGKLKANEFLLTMSCNF